jgi:hypothetical protein
MPREEEIAKIIAAIDALASARAQIRDYAANLGCPELL